MSEKFDHTETMEDEIVGLKEKEAKENDDLQDRVTELVEEVAILEEKVEELKGELKDKQNAIDVASEALLREV